MQGVHFFDYANLPGVGDKDGEYLYMLLSRPGYEIMQQNIDKNSTVWISPADKPTTIEFFMVMQGEVSLVVENPDLTEEEVFLKTGECFYVRNLKRDIQLVSKVDSKLLYISDMPVFSLLVDFNKELDDMLTQINEKDKKTRLHSSLVMSYTRALTKFFKSECTARIEDIILAALFHDVGKIRISERLLNDKTQFSQEDFKEMKKHPYTGAEILRSRYNDRMADIVLYHHERLDGSGYPYGIRGDEIPFESKIIAVAEAFDAMTSPRNYAPTKTPEEAIEELRRMSDKFEPRIVEKLAELSKNGQLKAMHKTLMDKAARLK